MLAALLEERAGGLAESPGVRGALEFAWQRLHRKFEAGAGMLTELGPEKLVLWTNYARFLCCALSYPTAAAEVDDYGAPDGAEPVSPAQLHTFWSQLLQLAWGGELREVPTLGHTPLASSPSHHALMLRHPLNCAAPRARRPSCARRCCVTWSLATLRASSPPCRWPWCSPSR